jgi:hypothetical protein
VRGFMFLENRLDGDDTDNMKMRLDCNLRTMLETKYSYSGARQFSAQPALPENNSIAARFALWLQSMNEYVVYTHSYQHCYTCSLLTAIHAASLLHMQCTHCFTCNIPVDSHSSQHCCTCSIAVASMQSSSALLCIDAAVLA